MLVSSVELWYQLCVDAHAMGNLLCLALAPPPPPWLLPLLVAVVAHLSVSTCFPSRENFCMTGLGEQHPAPPVMP